MTTPASEVSKSMDVGPPPQAEGAVADGHHDLEAPRKQNKVVGVGTQVGRPLVVVHAEILRYSRGTIHQPHGRILPM